MASGTPVTQDHHRSIKHIWDYGILAIGYVFVSASTENLRTR